MTKFNGTAADLLLTSKYPTLGAPKATHVVRSHAKWILQAYMPAKIGNLDIRVRLWLNKDQAKSLNLKP